VTKVQVRGCWANSPPATGRSALPGAGRLLNALQATKEVAMTGARRPKIVVGLDESDGAKDALRWAARLADALDADIEAVCVWEFQSYYGWASFPPLAQVQPDIEEQLTKTIDEVFGPERPDGLRIRVAEGSAAACLIEIGRDALMIVLGSRGHGTFTGTLIGAVSARVAEHATVPVLVVHGSVPAVIAG
jgi:nucleotide-binding universal stress UspA family protein